MNIAMIFLMDISRLERWTRSWYTWNKPRRPVWPQKRFRFSSYRLHVDTFRSRRSESRAGSEKLCFRNLGRKPFKNQIQAAAKSAAVELSFFRDPNDGFGWLVINDITPKSFLLILFNWEWYQSDKQLIMIGQKSIPSGVWFLASSDFSDQFLLTRSPNELGNPKVY